MSRVSTTSGGAAAAGGISFHARLGAIAGIHIIRGTPVQWTDGLTGAAPCAVSFETSGPGDDLSLELTDGSIVEIQAKKGLRAGERFWTAIDALCEGIHHDRCTYGILIVCPNSSVPVRQGYALALERIGEGRNDGASPLQSKLASHLAEKGYAAKEICARIRIRMVSAFEDAGDAIAAARAELGHVCVDDHQINSAWHALCQYALLAMSTKGRWSLRSLAARLRESGIEIKNTVMDSPVAISDRLLRWTMSRTQHFEVLGVLQPLPTDRAWLGLTAVIREASIERAASVEEALAGYHALGEKPRTNGLAIDARTIGTFRKLCVVVGGPGSGKSLLLKVLAREFAKDSYVSLKVRLRDLATRMNVTGCGVEEGLLQLGTDGTGVSCKQLRLASLPDLVLLCDGLDECGGRQDDIASGLLDMSISHPSYRIVVTTRPIGYGTRKLGNWRHYEIAPLNIEDNAKHLETLCRCVLGEDSTERANGLLPRIRAYLKERSVSSILARSPLLLTLGAALFLDRSGPGKTKLELYQRIFRLIDRTPAARATRRDTPTKAIRDRILNQIGWLIVVSPLSTAEELELQCARTMEQALGKTYLQALDEVQRSVRYWEQKGLIERLRHRDTDLIAFIHKTCGEYAAALHLSGMELNEAQQTIRSAHSIPDWSEILDFASRTPLATMVATLLVSKVEPATADESTLNRLLRVLVRPEVSLSPAKRRSFLEHVFAVIRSDDRQKAYRVGICLTDNDLSHMPEAEQLASHLIAAPTEWSRLVGWAVLACHFSSCVHRSDLEDALDDFVKRSSTRDFFVLQEWKFSFGTLHHPDRRILENFMLGALKSLLPGQDVRYQDRLIAIAREMQLEESMEFRSSFETLLKECGRDDALRSPFYSVKSIEALRSLDSGKFEAGYTAIWTEVVLPAFLEEDAGPAPQTSLKCLSAFVEMAGIMRVPWQDSTVWLSDDTQLDEVHALLRAAAHVYELPMDRLAAEARQAISTGGALSWGVKSTTLFGLRVGVDVAEVEWSRAGKSDIDMGVVERLIHHPSRWVQHLAASFIDERIRGPERRKVCERLLASGTGDALFWAAALTVCLPDGCELLVHRLGGRDTAGLHHLFDRLKEEGWPITPFYLAILESGLLQRGANMAVSAARWCEYNVSSADTWLVDLLQSASSYWLENEKPYLESRGTVPDSPRAALFRTLCRIVPPEFEEFVKLARDSRNDVRDAAIDGVIKLARESSDKRVRLVESIMAKQFSPQQCEKLIGSSVDYRLQELSILCKLFGDPDREYRLVAVRRVLTHPAMDPDKALAAADSLKGDDDGTVRDAVYQFMDRRVETVRQAESIGE